MAMLRMRNGALKEKNCIYKLQNKNKCLKHIKTIQNQTTVFLVYFVTGVTEDSRSNFCLKTSESPTSI